MAPVKSPAVVSASNMCRNPYVNPQGVPCPCRKCEYCRKKRITQLTMRALHEGAYHKEKSFVTLTYAPKYVPENYSLDKSDVQKFIKRLRITIERTPELKALIPKVKYIHAGEYGTELKRPHYHVIFYGIGTKPIYKKLLESTWGKGHVHVGTLTPDSIRYTAKYINKQLYGSAKESFIANTGRIPPYKTQSQGLGLQYCLDNAQGILYGLRLRYGDTLMAPPKYYLQKLAKNDTDKENLKYATQQVMIPYYLQQIAEKLHSSGKIQSLTEEFNAENPYWCDYFAPGDSWITLYTQSLPLDPNDCALPAHVVADAHKRIMQIHAEENKALADSLDNTLRVKRLMDEDLALNRRIQNNTLYGTE